MAEATFKPRYSDARICIFIHSALEIFYSILKCLSNREEADSVVCLGKSSLLHYIQNEVLGFPYVKVRAAGEQGVGVGDVWAASFLYSDNLLFLLVVLNPPSALFALPPCFINLNSHWKDWCWSSNTLAPDAKSGLNGKDPDAGEDWGQEKGATHDEMVAWHHRLHGHEFEQTPGRWWRRGKPGVL